MSKDDIKNQLNSVNSNENQRLLDDVCGIIERGREKAYAAVNNSIIETYWNIGRRIVEEEQQGKERAEYGEHIIENLSKQLTMLYGNGFSSRYLRSFRQFYLVVSDFQIWKSRFPNLIIRDDKVKTAECPKIAFRKTFAKSSCQFSGKCRYDLLSIVGAVVPMLLLFHDAFADMPVSLYHHRIDRGIGLQPSALHNLLDVGNEPETAVVMNYIVVVFHWVICLPYYEKSLWLIIICQSIRFCLSFCRVLILC